MEKERNIACQVSYIPINSANYPDDIDRVLEILKSHFPNCMVGDFSTVVYGSLNEVSDTLNEVISEMDAKGVQFNLQVNISNICGCKVK